MYKFRIKELRKKAGLTQRQVYIKIGMSDSAYRNIENNRVLNIRLKTLIKIKEALNVESLDDLFDFNSDE